MPDFKNCHFPGLYSIVLDEAPGPLYRRVYILPPGAGHPDLWIRDSGFLIHNHRYDFTSRTLYGVVVNRIFKRALPTDVDDDCEHLHEFAVESGITGEFATRPTGRIVRAYESQTRAVATGESYRMAATDFHAVEFHGGPRGWCVVEIEETRRYPPFDGVLHDGLRPGMAYSRRASISPRSDLYVPLDADDRHSLLAWMRASIGIDLT